MKNMKPQHIKIILHVFEPNLVYATTLILPTIIKSENQIDIFKKSTSLYFQNLPAQNCGFCLHSIHFARIAMIPRATRVRTPSR